MREDGRQQVCIVGLQEFRVSDVDTIKELIERGNATRSTGTTGANEESSRSHAILQLAIKKIVDGKELKPARLVGKLSFIDLAGSERGADTTDNDKQTRYVQRCDIIDTNKMPRKLYGNLEKVITYLFLELGPVEHLLSLFSARRSIWR